MSRIGKLPIKIPSGVTITADDNVIKVSGPKGELSQPLLDQVMIKVDGDQALIERSSDTKVAKSQHGLIRSLVNNMVIGVTEGFTKTLEVSGVGFKIALQGNKLVMNLGFSHPIEYQAPDSIDLAVDKMVIKVSGIDKQLVGQTAANIRKFKKPEPYKGKGIKYSDEYVIRKAGKTGAK